MITTRLNAAGQNEGTEEIQIGPIKYFDKVLLVNPSPSTARVDAAGASQGTTIQRHESSALILDEAAIPPR